VAGFRESAGAEMSDIHRNRGDLLKSPVFQVCQEALESKLGVEALIRAKANKCVGEARSGHFIAVDRRTTNQLHALALIEKDVTVAQLICLELFRREVHLHHIAGVNAIP
jgi:hypothetical protein